MPVTERLMDAGHKLVVTAMMTISLGGLTFIGAGCVDAVRRSQQRKAITASAKPDAE